MKAKKRYKIAVIEPSILLAEGLKTIFRAHPEFEIVSCTDNIPHFFERPTATPPEIILINPMVIDFQRQNHVKSIFSAYPGTLLMAIVYQFIDQDVLKQYHGSITVFDDANKIQKKLNYAINSSHNSPETIDSFDLSDRETEILVSVVKGLQNKEIADAHNISIHTVISHRKNIIRKTGIKSVAGLTVYALLHHLLDQHEIE
ncbi:MAG: LuxR C-terminal-related transcriptional regulator [Odoribacteraceae bacterium]|jgi:DNA-binding NarL/FixJ family response regulator|nr:LuxR C-terminal-related transcriptional regulator [Odoribacteraceae bacterium]